MKENAGDGPSVLLVSTPFYSVRTPSLQLGLLAAIGRSQGFSVDTLHLNLDFAARIGHELYEKLCQHRGPELGNWLFAKAAFRDDAPDTDGRFPYDFPSVVDPLDDLGVHAADLGVMRNDVVPEFLAYAETLVDWSRYQVVGFTCTFQQNTASFALARRLKDRFPSLVTLFGGANFEGAMGRELVRICPWIDYAIDGEADAAFPAFLKAVALGNEPQAIPGVVSQKASTPRVSQPFADLEGLPVPDFDEFFQRAGDLGINPSTPRSPVALPFESSRGCWWGQKHHCTFCGLNGTTMRFRQKSSKRVFDELAELSRRHGVWRFSAVDNIMPANFFKDFIPAMTKQDGRYDLFFEVKANMTRTQVKALSDAGIRSIQPGIESLNSHVLRLMDKGVRAAHNVNLLRWSRHYDIDVAWNLIWGFPNEEEQYYHKQATLLPHLVHLQPPHGANRIWLERFSPLYFDRSRFPVLRLEPEASLTYVYPSFAAFARLPISSITRFRTNSPIPYSSPSSPRSTHGTRHGPARFGRGSFMTSRWNSSASKTDAIPWRPGSTRLRAHLPTFTERSAIVQRPRKTSSTR